MKKIFSIILSILFLFSSVGVTFATHYCGGKVFSKKITYITNTDGCGMESDRQLPCEPNKSSVKKKSCCDDDLEIFKITDEYNPSSFDFNLNLGFLTAFFNSVEQLSSQTSSTFSKYKNYRPPLLERDITVLVQSFLI